MTIGTKTSAIRSASALDRCLGALGPPDELDDPGQRRVTADPRRAHHEGPGDVARRADDRVARPDRHRDRLAGQHRDVDVGAALDHGAVDRDRVAGPDAEEVADPDGLERDVAVAAVRDEPGRGRAEADQAPDRAGRPDLRPRLEPAAEQDEPDDDRRGIEVGDRLETGGDDDVRGEGDDDAVAPGRGRADRHQRVHVRGPVPGRPPCRPVEPSPGPDLDDRGRQDDEPVELDQGQRQARREHQDHDPERDRDRGHGLDRAAIAPRAPARRRPRSAPPRASGERPPRRPAATGRRSRPPRWRRRGRPGRLVRGRSGPSRPRSRG